MCQIFLTLRGNSIFCGTKSKAKKNYFQGALSFTKQRIIHKKKKENLEFEFAFQSRRPSPPEPRPEARTTTNPLLVWFRLLLLLLRSSEWIEIVEGFPRFQAEEVE